MKEHHISNADTIWKFHINPDNSELYIECKKDSKEFYLWNPIDDKRWTFPVLEKYVCVIMHVQYPYVLLSYFHEDNLMNQSILMCYDLESNTELWSSSELKLAEILKDELKVYSAKVEPKRYEYISIKKEKIENPKAEPLNLNVQHAEKLGNTHQLQYEDFNFELNISSDNQDKETSSLRILKDNNIVIEKKLDLEDARSEYDYLFRVENKFIVLLSKHELMLFQS